MAELKRVVWRLKAGSDRRFRTGHPWVYSNELSGSPKGIEPGVAVELCDAGGKFLARGYGNPHSLISFRAMTRDEAQVDPLSTEAIYAKLVAAGRLRKRLGLDQGSFRWCYGEADGIPGLIVDRYLMKKHQVLSIQAHTAGVDRLTGTIIEALEKCCAAEWERTSIVLRNDLGIRKLEGLEEKSPEAVRNPGNQDLRKAAVLIRSASGGDPLTFETDLIHGQKTGFFLDQAGNVELAARKLAPLAGPGPVRILDLCCFVGQWGAQLARAFKQTGRSVEVTSVDASADALAFAKANVEAAGAACRTLKGDVLKDLVELEDGAFDFVVCDPPAFARNRKDLPKAAHAYLQLNTQAMRVLKPGGALVSCSCSSLLNEEELAGVLAKASRRNASTFSWIARGSQSADHPILAEFPEGRYLKCWIGIRGESR